MLRPFASTVISWRNASSSVTEWLRSTATSSGNSNVTRCSTFSGTVNASGMERIMISGRVRYDSITRGNQVHSASVQRFGMR